VCEGDADTLGALVAKSLVVQDSRGPEPRYRFLETTRQYALSHFEVSEEREIVRERHAGYFANVAYGISHHFGPLYESETIVALDRDEENFHTALAWLLEHGDFAGAIRLCKGLRSYWAITGHRIGLDAFDRMLEESALSIGDRAWLHFAHPGMLHFIKDTPYEDALEHAKRALEPYRQAGTISAKRGRNFRSIVRSRRCAPTTKDESVRTSAQKRSSKKRTKAWVMPDYCIMPASTHTRNGGARHSGEHWFEPLFHGRFRRRHRDVRERGEALGRDRNATSVRLRADESWRRLRRDAAKGDAATAACAFSFAGARFKEKGLNRQPGRQTTDYKEAEDAVRAVLGDHEFGAQWRRGEALPAEKFMEPASSL
jgi:hypothetical protein